MTESVDTDHREPASKETPAAATYQRPILIKGPRLAEVAQQIGSGRTTT